MCRLAPAANVMASAPMARLDAPPNSMVAPEATVVAPPVPPKALLLATRNVPLLMLVAPVNVLLPDKVKLLLALPSLINAPAPEIMPDKVSLAEEVYLNAPPLVLAMLMAPA